MTEKVKRMRSVSETVKIKVGMWLCAILIVAALGAFIGCGGGGGDTARSSFSGGGGTSSPTPSGPPEVTGLDPANPIAGQGCTITGKNFGTFDAATCDVTFGGVSAKTGLGRGVAGIIEKGITSWADTQIVVTVPNNVPATGNVVVTTAQGSSSATGGGFTTARSWRGATVHTDPSFTGAPGAHKILVDPRDSNKNDFLYVSVNGSGLFSKRWNGVTGAWENAKRIDVADAFTPSSPDFAFASNGNAICVFIENNQLFANFYDAASDSWNGTLVRLDATGTNVATPKVLFHNGSDAWVVFVERDPTGPAQDAIYARKYSSGQPWGAGAFGAATQIDFHNGASAFGSSQPAVAFDPAGNTGFCLFRKQTNTVPNRYRTFYARYAGGAWTAAVAGNTLDTGEGQLDGWPTIAMNSSGNALAVFYDAAINNLSASWYSATSGTWSATPTIIETTGSSSAVFNPVAFDASGNAIVVFQQGGPGGQEVSVNRRSPGDSGTWSGPVFIDVTTGLNAVDQYLMFEPAGTKSSVLFARDVTTGFRVYANRYDATTNTWNGPELIDNGTAGNYTLPITSMDKGFNIFGKWIDATNVHYNYYH